MGGREGGSGGGGGGGGVYKHNCISINQKQSCPWLSSSLGCLPESNFRNYSAFPFCSCASLLSSTQLKLSIRVHIFCWPGRKVGKCLWTSEQLYTFSHPGFARYTCFLGARTWSLKVGRLRAAIARAVKWVPRKIPCNEKVVIVCLGLLGFDWWSSLTIDSIEFRLVFIPIAVYLMKEFAGLVERAFGKDGEKLAQLNSKVILRLGKKIYDAVVKVFVCFWCSFVSQTFSRMYSEIHNKMKHSIKAPGNLKEYSPWLSNFQASNHPHTMEIPGENNLYFSESYSCPLFVAVVFVVVAVVDVVVIVVAAVPFVALVVVAAASLARASSIVQFALRILIISRVIFNLQYSTGQYTGRMKPLPEYHVKIAGFDERVSCGDNSRSSYFLQTRFKMTHQIPKLRKRQKALKF